MHTQSLTHTLLTGLYSGEEQDASLVSSGLIRDLKEVRSHLALGNQGRLMEATGSSPFRPLTQARPHPRVDHSLFSVTDRTRTRSGENGPIGLSANVEQRSSLGPWSGAGSLGL